MTGKLNDVMAKLASIGPCQRVGCDMGETVPAYRLAAVESVLRVREAELLALKGPCRTDGCTLHRAHSGPCDIESPAVGGS